MEEETKEETEMLFYVLRLSPAPIVSRGDVLAQPGIEQIQILTEKGMGQ